MTSCAAPGQRTTNQDKSPARRPIIALVLPRPICHPMIELQKQTRDQSIRLDGTFGPINCWRVRTLDGAQESPDGTVSIKSNSTARGRRETQSTEWIDIWRHPIQLSLHELDLHGWALCQAARTRFCEETETGSLTTSRRLPSIHRMLDSWFLKRNMYHLIELSQWQQRNECRAT